MKLFMVSYNKAYKMSYKFSNIKIDFLHKHQSLLISTVYIFHSLKLGIALLAGALAKPATESKPEDKSDADALVYYNLHGYWPVWYFGYHLIGKRSAEDEAKPERKSDADAWLYYTTYGYWPAWYIGYYLP